MGDEFQKMGDKGKERYEGILRRMTENEKVSCDDLVFFFSFISGIVISEHTKSQEVCMRSLLKLEKYIRIVHSIRLAFATLTSSFGIFFLGFAAYIGITQTETFAPILFAGIGITSIVSTFIILPDKTTKDAARAMLLQKIAIDTWLQGSVSLVKPADTIYGQLARYYREILQATETESEEDRKCKPVLEAALRFSDRTQATD